jgi:hypothetical protein
MLRVLFTLGGQKVARINNFKELWEEILKYKELNKTKESPNFIGLQNDYGRMLLLALYDDGRWFLGTLEEDWGTQFGKIDLAKDFNVREALLNDRELKKRLRKFMTSGSLPL